MDIFIRAIFVRKSGKQSEKRRHLLMQLSAEQIRVFYKRVFRFSFILSSRLCHQYKSYTPAVGASWVYMLFMKGENEMHLRTIREAAAWYKDYDPSTAVTEHLIRNLVVSGKVPSTRSGRKYLITTESEFSYFFK